MINRVSTQITRKARGAQQRLHSAHQKIKLGVHKAKTLVHKAVSGAPQDLLDDETFRKQLTDHNRAAKPLQEAAVSFGKNQVRRTVTGHQMAGRLKREKAQGTLVQNNRASTNPANAFDAASDAADREPTAQKEPEISADELLQFAKSMVNPDAPPEVEISKGAALTVLQREYVALMEGGSKSQPELQAFHDRLRPCEKNIGENDWKQLSAHAKAGSSGEYANVLTSVLERLES